ncbi:hypothetical protein [Hymenobacter weizhouensis]|uniref:hypothetical protein n=1 Tax=Hymenobacter sp. YIM 151500-1 TaxID=2987689 RepID=UPI002225E7F5|nr:hypothetical protein [Hymenobacter sp. YIM 151500-1]UYZ62304.1 hypothetical protein OIS53_15050 [Hymenobacter sp. YIM 151500-1]
MLLVLTSLEIQYFLIAVLAAGAAWYVGRLFWRAFFAQDQTGCAKGCGACSTIDVDRLQRTIEVAAARKAGQ